LMNLENVGVAVEISLLSSVRAEIYVISYLLPVNGPSLIYDIPRHRTVFPLVSQCYLTPKTWV